MKKIKVVICFCLIAVILIITPIAYQKTKNKEEFPLSTQKYNMVLSLWQIDTFEGGKGARSDYLTDLLSEFSKEGVYVLVSSYTVEGAREKMKNNVYPDITSFSIGAPFMIEGASKLSGDFKGGEILGNTLALPWCRGGYFLISKNAINEHIDRLIVSKGEYNNPLAALYFSSYRAKEIVVKEPKEAISEYLKSDDVLLGTQRDIWRLLKQGKEFKATPIEKFCDLYQYIAVTCRTEEKFKKATEAAEYIVKNSKENLEEIGMMPIDKNFYDEPLGLYDVSKTEYTISPFTAVETLKETHEFLNEGKSDKETGEKLKNIIKQL